MRNVALTEEEIEKSVFHVTSHILEFFLVEEIKTLHCWGGGGSASLSTAQKGEVKMEVLSLKKKRNMGKLKAIATKDSL